MSALEQLLKDNRRWLTSPDGAAMAGTLIKAFPCRRNEAQQRRPAPGAETRAQRASKNRSARCDIALVRLRHLYKQRFS